jgi:hypothetical protein
MTSGRSGGHRITPRAATVVVLTVEPGGAIRWRF